VRSWLQRCVRGASLPRSHAGTPSPGGAGKYEQVGGRVSGSAVAALADLEEVLGEAVIAVVSSGDAIFFGTTRDGTAVVVRVYSEAGNGEWFEGSNVGLDSTLRGLKDAANLA